MVVLVPSALYQNPETKWLFCSPIKDAFHTKELFPNSHPPKKSIGHRNPHEGSIPDNNLIDKSVLRNHEPQAAFRKLELCFRMWWSLPIGSWPTRTPHKMFSVSWTLEQLRIGRLPLSRAKLGAKDWRVKQIRPELSSKKWPEVRDVLGTIGRSIRWCTEFIGEDLWVKDHYSSGLLDHLSLSFNTALRQVII